MFIHLKRKPCSLDSYIFAASIIFAELYEKGIAKPSAEQLVEPEETIRKRYRVAKEKYGERMTFTGPDCGLGGWPTQDAAALLLKRTVEAVKTA